MPREFTAEEIERQDPEQTAMRRHNLEQEAAASKKKRMGKPLPADAWENLSAEERYDLSGRLIEDFAGDAAQLKFMRERERDEQDRKARALRRRRGLPE